MSCEPSPQPYSNASTLLHEQTCFILGHEPQTGSVHLRNPQPDLTIRSFDLLFSDYVLVAEGRFNAGYIFCSTLVFSSTYAPIHWMFACVYRKFHEGRKPVAHQESTLFGSTRL